MRIVGQLILLDNNSTTEMESLKLKLIEAIKQIDQCYLEFCLPIFSLDSPSGCQQRILDIQIHNDSISKEEIVNMACDIRNSLRKVLMIFS